jgi:hypothetical protein
VESNLYYRLSGYSISNEQVYSEIVSVIAIDDYKTPSGSLATTPITPDCIEETNSSSGASK